MFYYGFMGVKKAIVSELISLEDGTDKCSSEECGLYIHLAKKQVLPDGGKAFTWDEFRQLVADRLKISIAILGDVIKLNKAREEVLKKACS